MVIRSPGASLNGIVHLIIIRRKRHGEVPDGIFGTKAEVVGGLGLEVLITQIEIHTIHILDILVVQLLRCGRFVALAPSSPEAQLTKFQHG